VTFWAGITNGVLSMVTVEDAEEKLHIKLDPWQKEFINDESPKIILRNGRKTGKTRSAAIKIALDVINKDFSNTDGILITSKKLQNAKDILLEVRGILNLFGFTFGRVKDDDEDHYATMTDLQMQSGNRVRAMPCGFDGSSIRPYSFFKIFRDEDAWTPAAVDAAVNSCLATYGVQEIRASTPYGTGGSFWKAEQTGMYKVYHIRTADAKFKDYSKYLADQRKRLSRTEYLQEHDAEYQELANGIYPRWLTAACMMKDPNWKVIEEECDGVFLGIDYARFGDDVNIVSWAYVKDGVFNIRIKEIESRYRTTHVNGFIIAEARRLDRKFRKVITDGGGMGAVTDYLIEALGKSKVIEIVNQSKDIPTEKKQNMKVQLHNNLIFMLENGKVRLDDDPDIIRSLSSIRFKHSSRGEALIVGKRFSHAAEAIVRACYPHLVKIGAKKNIFFGAIEHSEIFNNSYRQT
jgi:hypothetical protein